MVYLGPSAMVFGGTVPGRLEAELEGEGEKSEFQLSLLQSTVPEGCCLPPTLPAPLGTGTEGLQHAAHP